MFTLFMILELMFLINGGIGLFYTNINFSSGSHYWIFGNLVFGTFTLTGILTLIFMALFNTEFDQVLHYCGQNQTLPAQAIPSALQARQAEAYRFIIIRLRKTKNYAGSLCCGHPDW